MSTAVDTNNILTVKRRPTQAKAVQFTGKNGAEIVAFVNDLYKPNPGFHLRNGGSYVQVEHSRVRKGDWLVLEVTGGLYCLPNDDFIKLYSIKG